MLNAALTAAQNDDGTATGYQGGSDPRGTLDDATFAYRGSGYRIDSLSVSGSTLSLEIHPNVSADSYSRWNLKIGGETFALGDASNSPDADADTLTVQWDAAGLSWTNGQQVRVRIVEPLDWEPVQHESSLNTATSFNDVEERGSRNFVYRVKPNNAAGLTPYAFRGDWAFNDGDPGGEPNQDGDHTTIDDTAVEVAVPESETANSPATGAPTITGTPQVNQTLTASTSGIADPDGTENATFTYQWLRNNGSSDEEIGGATRSTYTAVSTDLGKTLKVRVDFTDDDENSESLTSLATDAVTATPNREATGAPTVGGTPQVDETLTADTSGISDADGLVDVSYIYQWIRGDADIAGATGSSYTLAPADQGHTMKVRVSFTDDADNAESLTSVTTMAVVAAPNRDATGAPAISGTPQVDQILAADTSAITDQDGLTSVSYKYQCDTRSRRHNRRDQFDLPAHCRRSRQAHQGASLLQRRPRQQRNPHQRGDRHRGGQARAAHRELLRRTRQPFRHVVRVHAHFQRRGRTQLQDTPRWRFHRGRRQRHQGQAHPEGAATSAGPSGSDQTATATVTITLPATTDCDATGAICTEDGRKLSNHNEFTVSGSGG